MKLFEVGAFEAKNRLSELLAQVEKGQRIYITRRGKRVAMLSRPIEPAAPAGRQDLLRRFRALRESARKGPESLKQLVEEGR